METKSQLIKRSIKEATRDFFAPSILVAKVVGWFLSGGSLRR
ncbi:MAG: hypothetical protein ACRER5_03020 [Pseudomonas sp.]